MIFGIWHSGGLCPGPGYKVSDTNDEKKKGVRIGVIIIDNASMEQAALSQSSSSNGTSQSRIAISIWHGGNG
jgi:hypothetical protein